MTTKRNASRWRVNPPIGKALAADALQRFDGAFPITHAKRGAVVVAEIELVHVALQMLFANMMERPDQPTLEDGEVTFNRVGGDLATRIFTKAVVH